MRTAPLAFAFLLLLGLSPLLSCGSARVAPPSIIPSGKVLYVVNNGTVTTYSIDPGSLAATAMEQPVDLVPSPANMMQFEPSPDDHFVYAVWSDGQNLQHLSVFQTDSSGVPQVPAIQTLDADSLSQFNLHPSGQFAYMLEVTSSNNQYQADIRLFNVQGSVGTLKENPQVQGKYGPTSYWPAFLYGFSTDASKLYDTSAIATGAVYRQRPINLKTGTLGSDQQLLSVSHGQEVVLGKVIVDQFINSANSNQNFLQIFANVPNPSQAMIHCTAAMLSFCATATNVQLDPSGHFLILTDPVTQEIHVAGINLPGKKIKDTGNSIPMTSQIPGFAFSPDGSILYAMLASDDSVHFYHFDHTSGSISEGGAPLVIPPGTGLCPAQYK